MAGSSIAKNSPSKGEQNGSSQCGWTNGQQFCQKLRRSRAYASKAEQSRIQRWLSTGLSSQPLDAICVKRKDKLIVKSQILSGSLPAQGLSQDSIDAQGLAAAARYREKCECTLPNFTDDATRFDYQFAAGYIVMFLNEQDSFLVDPDGYRAELQQRLVPLLQEARIIKSDHHTPPPAARPIQPNTLCRVLIATRETQGRRSNDFHWAQEGEDLTASFGVAVSY